MLSPERLRYELYPVHLSGSVAHNVLEFHDANETAQITIRYER